MSESNTNDLLEDLLIQEVKSSPDMIRAEMPLVKKQSPQATREEALKSASNEKPYGIIEPEPFID